MVSRLILLMYSVVPFVFGFPSCIEGVVCCTGSTWVVLSDQALTSCKVCGSVCLLFLLFQFSSALVKAAASLGSCLKRTAAWAGGLDEIKK